MTMTQIQTRASAGRASSAKRPSSKGKQAASIKERIRALHEQGLSTREIAMAIYAAELGRNPAWRDLDRRMAYVRVVIRQRRFTGSSPADRAYQATTSYRQHRNAQMRRYRKRRYAVDPKYRAQCRTWWARWYWEGGGRKWKAAYKKRYSLRLKKLASSKRAEGLPPASRTRPASHAPSSSGASR